MATTFKFQPGIKVVNAKGRVKEPTSQTELDEYIEDGYDIDPSGVQPEKALSIPPAQQRRVVAPPLTPNGTKEQRRLSREKNQAGSMVIPEKFRIDGLEHEAKIIAFPEKFSARTGNTYFACQLQCEGTKFCVLDPGDKYDVGMTVNLRFFESDNPNIVSGFEVEVSL